MTQSGFTKGKGSKSQSTKMNGVAMKQEDNMFMYTLGILIGGVAEILTESGERFEGIFSAYSQSSDELMFEAAHRVNDVENEKIKEHYDVLIVPSDKIVHIKLKNLDVSYACKEKEFQTDGAIVKRSRSHKMGDKELTPWDGGDGDGHELNDNGTTSNGWEAHEMFKKNEEKYGVVSSFKQDLSGYTTKLDQSDDSFKKHEQRASKIAEEIEGNGSSWERSQVENVDDEEGAYSAVVRPTTTTTTTTITFNNTNFSNSIGSSTTTTVGSVKYVVPSRRPPQVVQLSNGQKGDEPQQMNVQQQQPQQISSKQQETQKINGQQQEPQLLRSKQQDPEQINGQQQQNCTLDHKTDTSIITTHDNNARRTPPINARGTPPIKNNPRGTPPINNNACGTPPIDNNPRGTPPMNNNDGTPPINNKGSPPSNNNDTNGHARPYNQHPRGYSNGRHSNSYESYDRQRGYTNSRGGPRSYQSDYSNGRRQDDDNGSRQNGRPSNGFRRGGRGRGGGRDGDDRGTLRSFGAQFHLKSSGPQGSSNPPRVRTPQNKSPSPVSNTPPPPGSENDVISQNNPSPPPPPSANSDLQSQQISSTQSTDCSETKDEFSPPASSPPAIELVSVPASVYYENSNNGSEGSFNILMDTSSSSPSNKSSLSPSSVNETNVTPESTRSNTTSTTCGNPSVTPAIGSKDNADSKVSVEKKSKKVPFTFNPNVKDFRPAVAVFSRENSPSTTSSASSTPVPQIPPFTPSLQQQQFVYTNHHRYTPQPSPGLAATVPTMPQQGQCFFIIPGPGQGGVPQQMVRFFQPFPQRMMPVYPAEGGGPQMQYYVHNPPPNNGGQQSNNCSLNQNAVSVQGPIYGQVGGMTNGTHCQIGYPFTSMPIVGVGCPHRPPPQMVVFPQQPQQGTANPGMQQHNQQ